VIEIVAMDERMWHAARRQAVSDVEQACFFLARPRGPVLECHAMRTVDADGFACQTAAHIALTDELAAELIGWAARQRSCLIELHSHGGRGAPCLSATDISGLEEWVPHVRWRLGSVPYVALVQSRTAIDGLAWADGPSPVALTGVAVGAALIPASGRSFQRWYA
jgi:hypothetical protein